MSDTTVRGRFVWHELLTTDPESAAAFFAKVIGWKRKAWEGDPSYTLLHVGERGVAGLMALPEAAQQSGATPHWLTYIGTPDVDETAKLATSMGAKIRSAPEDIPNVGRFAVLEDSHGAVFGIYTPDQSRPETPPAPGEFSWHELATTDARAAMSFYRRLFGWEETSAMDMGPELGLYHMFAHAKNGPPTGGIFTKPAQMPGPSNWLPYIKVADAKTSAAAVKKHGGQVINGPMEVPGGDWIAQGLDLQSAMFAVHSAKTPAVGTTTVVKSGGAVRSAKARKAASGSKKTGRTKRVKKAKAGRGLSKARTRVGATRGRAGKGARKRPRQQAKRKTR